MSQRNPPLWEVMRAAYFRDGASNPAARYANQILVISDAIPEQLYGAEGIKAWLLEEANRAFRVPDQIH